MNVLIDSTFIVEDMEGHGEKEIRAHGLAEADDEEGVLKATELSIVVAGGEAVHSLGKGKIV